MVLAEAAAGSGSSLLRGDKAWTSCAVCACSSAAREPRGRGCCGRGRGPAPGHGQSGEAGPGLAPALTEAQGLCSLAS